MSDNSNGLEDASHGRNLKKCTEREDASPGRKLKKRTEREDASPGRKLKSLQNARTLALAES